MTDNSSVSVVIPTYNNEAVLTECLQALSRQSVEQSCFEVIVVNDGGDGADAAALDRTVRMSAMTPTLSD